MTDKTTQSADTEESTQDVNTDDTTVSSSLPNTPLLESTTVNDTYIPTQYTNVTSTNGPGMSSERNLAIGLSISIILICIFILILIYYLYKKRRLHVLPCLKNWTPRKNSGSVSRQPLQEDDAGSVDAPETIRDRKMDDLQQDFFTIGDVDEERNKANPDDEFFMDEVYGRSEFQDEVTKMSNRNLYSITSDEDDSSLLDDNLPDLSFR